jgi:outer membrane protein OmpA-like peptidoglycan-associated protein
METISYGEEKPKQDGESEDAYAKNRRASFRVNVK